MSNADLERLFYLNQLGLPSSGLTTQDLQRLYYNQNVAGIASNRRYASGAYYPISVPGPSVSAGALSVGNLTVFPFNVGESQTFDRIGIGVTVVGSAGSVIRLGIYDSTSAGIPNNLLDGSGAIVTDAGLGAKEFTISRQLNPGLFWLGVVAQVAAPTVRQIQASWSEFVGTNVVDQGQTVVGYFQSGVAGALPSTFTHSFANTHGGAAPLLMLRAA